MRMAVQKIRRANPGCKIGVCGEHGGDPKSIRFFDDLGLDYVSCSPFRIPIAKISAAQCHIEAVNRKYPLSPLSLSPTPSPCSLSHSPTLHYNTPTQMTNTLLIVTALYLPSIIHPVPLSLFAFFSCFLLTAASLLGTSLRRIDWTGRRRFNYG